jgi:hypothetical protein
MLDLLMAVDKLGTHSAAAAELMANGPGIVLQTFKPKHGDMYFACINNLKQQRAVCTQTHGSASMSLDAWRWSGYDTDDSKELHAKLRAQCKYWAFAQKK